MGVRAGVTSASSRVTFSSRLVSLKGSSGWPFGWWTMISSIAPSVSSAPVAPREFPWCRGHGSFPDPQPDQFWPSNSLPEDFPRVIHRTPERSAGREGAPSLLRKGYCDPQPPDLRVQTLAANPGRRRKRFGCIENELSHSVSTNTVLIQAKGRLDRGCVYSCAGYTLIRFRVVVQRLPNCFSRDSTTPVGPSGSKREKAVSSASSVAVTPSRANSAASNARSRTNPTATPLIIGMVCVGLNHVFKTALVATDKPHA
jgi:hypothetical protein